ncbi:MAG: NIL domain-containing protein [Candidatus Omnitrophica bacterium]|nr:NIL domain-containing protein [Candidatus Omnitrophota bacterium]
MTKVSIVLHFPKDLVDKPIVYRLVKDFNLSFNILKAEINPQEGQGGLLVLELEGDEKDYKKGIEYLKKSGLKLQLLSKDISMDRTKCVDCTICVPLCPTKALVKDAASCEVKFIKDECIACGICIKACPYGAMTISF